jgi:UDP-N-acetylmuramyl tripeptide synthase
VIVLAGKGHEDYQEINGERHAFSDLVEADHALTAWEAPMLKPMKLSELTTLNARLVGADASFDGVSIDSRAIKPGQLFVALTGRVSMVTTT